MASEVLLFAAANRSSAVMMRTLCMRVSFCMTTGQGRPSAEFGMRRGADRAPKDCLPVLAERAAPSLISALCRGLLAQAEGEGRLSGAHRAGRCTG